MDIHVYREWDKGDYLLQKVNLQCNVYTSVALVDIGFLLESKFHRHRRSCMHLFMQTRVHSHCLIQVSPK